MQEQAVCGNCKTFKCEQQLENRKSAQAHVQQIM